MMRGEPLDVGHLVVAVLMTGRYPEPDPRAGHGVTRRVDSRSRTIAGVHPRFLSRGIVTTSAMNKLSHIHGRVLVVRRAAAACSAARSPSGAPPRLPRAKHPSSDVSHRRLRGGARAGRIDLAGRAPVCGLPQSSLADEDRDRVLREVRDLDRPRLAPLKERVRSALGVSCGRTDEVTFRADGHLLASRTFTTPEGALAGGRYQRYR